jgi:hypothetical protein
MLKDKLIAAILAEGRYTVDPIKGTISNGRGPKRFSPNGKRHRPNHLVHLYHYGENYDITASVGRVIAIAYWGYEAVKDRHVYRKDTDIADYSIGNLRLSQTTESERREQKRQILNKLREQVRKLERELGE